MNPTNTSSMIPRMTSSFYSSHPSSSKSSSPFRMLIAQNGQVASEVHTKATRARRREDRARRKTNMIF